ncbi:MAG: 6-carboxytetrahydropterin synthase [Candidatus Binatia bacterium]
MYDLTRRVEFEASHRYWQPAFSTEENHRIFGKCVSPYGHGHNYVLRVTLSGQVDPRTGMVINIKELDRILKEVAAEFDHKFINLDHPAFQERIPTTESLASYMRDEIESKLHAEDRRYALSRVTLYEEPTLWADVLGGEGRNMASLTKTFSFSAAHRLHSPALSDEENRAVFGKCNNLHGHGHNYELEVTVTGKIDPPTGMIMDLGLLMQTVQDAVIERFDHKHLNEDTVEFRALNPTGENIVKVIWDLLKPKLGAGLSRVGLWETPKNFFEYHGA